MSIRHVTDSRRPRPGPKGERGMTLTELLIVLAIISVTALIALPTVQRSRVQSRTNQGVQRVGGQLPRP